MMVFTVCVGWTVDGVDTMSIDSVWTTHDLAAERRDKCNQTYDFAFVEEFELDPGRT